MKTIVIFIGGSVILSDNINLDYFNKLYALLDKIKNYKIFIVVGGGKIARDYINFGRKLNFKENTLDYFGILITRINARLLSNIFKNSNSIIPETTNDAINMKNKIVIMGGTIPGHSTDYVGSEIAAKTKAEKFIIATNVDGVYNKDPNIYSDAKHIEEITAVELIKKYGISWKSAGGNVIIDGPALKKINDNQIITYVINGKKIDVFENALFNKKFKGTIIKK